MAPLLLFGMRLLNAIFIASALAGFVLLAVGFEPTRFGLAMWLGMVLVSQVELAFAYRHARLQDLRIAGGGQSA